MALYHNSSMSASSSGSEPSHVHPLRGIKQGCPLSGLRPAVQSLLPPSGGGVAGPPFFLAAAFNVCEDDLPRRAGICEVRRRASFVFLSLVGAALVSF
eukprot:2399973-Pyramimonas_sp.AAC.1